MSFVSYEGESYLLDRMKPAFRVYVDGKAVRRDLLEYVIDISYEQHVDMASKLSITLENGPVYDDDGKRLLDFKFSDDPIMEPGAEVEVWMGYSTDTGKDELHFIGRAEIVRHLPNLGTDVPTLEIIGYDRSYRMMHSETRVTDGRAPSKASNPTYRWDGPVAAIVENVLDIYGMQANIELPDHIAFKEMKFDQPKGMSYYEMLKSLANIHDAEFFVEWHPEHRSLPYSRVTDNIFFEYENQAQKALAAGERELVFRPDIQKAPPGKWVGVFRAVPELQIPPKGTYLPPDQKTQTVYTFRYGVAPETSGNSLENGTITRLSLEWGINNAVSEITVMFYDRHIQEWRELSVSEDAARRKAAYKTVVEEREIPKATAHLIKEQRKHTNAKGAFTNQEIESVKDQVGKLGFFDRVETTKRKVKVRKKIRGPRPGLFEPGGAAATVKSIDGEDVIPIKIAASGYSNQIVPEIRFRTAQEAIDYALRWFKRNVDDYITADAVMLGFELLRAGQIHRLEGCGKRYEGMYYFIRVEHRISSAGYFTSFTARKHITPNPQTTQTVPGP